MAPQLVLYAAESLESCKSGASVCADGHGESVENNIFFSDAVLFGALKNAPRYLNSAVGGVGDPVFVKGESYDKSAVLFGKWEHLFHALGLAADGIYHGFPVISAESRLHGIGIRGVDLQGQVADCLDFADGVGEHGCLVDFGKTHVHVQNMDAPVTLSEGFG